METMEVSIENPIISPKETPASPTVSAATLLPADILQAPTTDDDDDCVICYQTLYRPAKTECNHSACESCMLHWALMAMDVKPEDQHLSMALHVDGMKFKCPTCRGYTSATFDAQRDELLRTRYPDDYASRAAESGGAAADEPADEYAVQTMVLMTGNSHRKVPPSISPHTGMARTHEFTFFVQSSRQELVEQVDVILHPTFREDRLVTLREPPFSTTHLAWGYFHVFAGVTLRKGWEWVDEDRAVDSDKAAGRCTDRLPVEWMLDFGGSGSQRNRLVRFRKVRKEEGGEGDDEAKEEEEVSEDELDLGPLAELMSESEIAQLREVRRMKKAREQAGRERP